MIKKGKFIQGDSKYTAYDITLEDIKILRTSDLNLIKWRAIIRAVALII